MTREHRAIAVLAPLARILRFRGNYQRKQTVIGFRQRLSCAIADRPIGWNDEVVLIKPDLRDFHERIDRTVALCFLVQMRKESPKLLFRRTGETNGLQCPGLMIIY